MSFPATEFFKCEGTGKKNPETNRHNTSYNTGIAVQDNAAQLSGGIWVRIPQELDIVAFWSWNLDVVVFWSWNLNVVVMCLHGLVFVIMVKTKKPRIIMSMLLRKISVVQIYAKSICIMSELE